MNITLIHSGTAVFEQQCRVPSGGTFSTYFYRHLAGWQAFVLQEHSAWRHTHTHTFSRKEQTR